MIRAACLLVVVLVALGCDGARLVPIPLPDAGPVASDAGSDIITRPPQGCVYAGPEDCSDVDRDCTGQPRDIALDFYYPPDHPHPTCWDAASQCSPGVAVCVDGARRYVGLVLSTADDCDCDGQADDAGRLIAWAIDTSGSADTWRPAYASAVCLAAATTQHSHAATVYGGGPALPSDVVAGWGDPLCVALPSMQGSYEHQTDAVSALLARHPWPDAASTRQVIIVADEQPQGSSAMDPTGLLTLQTMCAADLFKLGVVTRLRHMDAWSVTLGVCGGWIAPLRDDAAELARYLQGVGP